jgi:hypothetical protein
VDQRSQTSPRGLARRAACSAYRAARRGPTGREGDQGRQKDVDRNGKALTEHSAERVTETPSQTIDALVAEIDRAGGVLTAEAHKLTRSLVEKSALSRELFLAVRPARRVLFGRWISS